jgi:predicted O-methyltransferase YrrM
MSAIPEKKLFLEIGSYEGRSTCWLLQNGLSAKGSIVCVDPFPNLNEVEGRFWTNINEARKDTQVVSAFKKPSYQALAEMIGHKYVFDFIYVDGSHAPDAALTDACMAWGLLRQGGIMLFDDYLYPEEQTKDGIDAFLCAFLGKFEPLINNYQLAVRKK